jgi:two-component system, sensor histidine kinase and response regulator
MNKKRILLSEDSTTSQQICLAILKKLGYTADVATNGREALKALHSASYDLVLMDCQMPEMDGYETSRLVRDPATDIPNHGIPIIALTADVSEGGREKCLEAGMNDYITKPLDPKELAGALAKWLPAESKADVSGVTDVPERAKACGEGEGPVFDENEVLGRLDGDWELLDTVVTGFLQDMPKQLFMLRTVIQSGDPTAANLQAHKVKGAAAAVGAETMRAAASRIEEVGKTGRIETMSRLFAELNEQFEKFKAAWGMRQNQ